MKKVLAFGVFDHFHKGHEFYLKKATELGDRLFVLVACSQDVLRVKKREPDHSEEKRLEAVQSLPFVRRAFLGKPVKSKSDYLNSIIEIKPDVIALGYDQALKEEEWLRDEVRKINPETEIVRLKAFKPEVFKSSLVKKALPSENRTEES